MNAPWSVIPSRSIDDLRAFFTGVCENRADLYADGVLSLHEAVDELQAIAELTGLVAAIGQDEVQQIIGGAPSVVPDLVEPDDVSEAYEPEIRRRAAELVRQWELDDPRDAWKHTGELRPPVQPATTSRRKSCTPPQSTVDAFLYVAALDDVPRLKGWLDDHRADAPVLLKLLKAKLCK